jgi:Integrase core domain/Chromo (CHRromatin Organisation MOdifier) domain
MSAVKTPVISYTHTTSTYKPMECLNIDFIGPFPDKGSILVMIDTFTRFVELYATPDATAKSACTALVEHTGRYGAPRYLRSDNGPHFANHVIDEFLKIVGSIHEKILPYSSEHNAIVERMNKEVNRHIRAYTYARATTENYQEILPFVQRILNTTVNAHTKITPAQLLYGNAINMDDGILIPRGEVNLIPENITASSTKMLKMQEELIKISAKILKESDDLHNAAQRPDVTQFEVGSYVLAAQRTQPETRMHTLWRGPFRVLSNNKGEYTLLNLITQKDIRYHMSQLKTFLFDPLHTDPTDVARRDYLEFFIEDIIDMRGQTSSYGTLEFEVKWLNYPSESNTWEPWKNLRRTDKLHEFLIRKNLRHLIPREFRLDYV